LNLSCLLFELRSEKLDLFLLLRGPRLQFLNPASFEDLLQLRQAMLSTDGKEKAFATGANAFPIRLGV